MRKLFIVVSIAAFMLAACSSNQPKEDEYKDGTHQHDDGSVHQNNKEEKAKQEEFSVSADTLAKQPEKANKHTHDGHEHSHKH